MSEILILGNGGAINEGLDYNAFMIGESCLCEVPPDIMNSLYRNRVRLSEINTVFISHFHGDHCFGLPFLFLSLLVIGSKAPDQIRFVGPSGIRDLAVSLTETAFTKLHPCLPWIEKHCVFHEISDGSSAVLAGYEAEFFAMSHFSETYGFALRKNGRVPFSYAADTVWCQRLGEMIFLRPEKMLIDLNGEPADIQKVHLSEKELIEKAFPLSKDSVEYYGTHLRTDRVSTVPHLTYVKSGDRVPCSA